VILIPLHLLLKPLALSRIVDMHELHANGTAVRGTETFDNLPQRDRVLLAKRSAGKFAIEVLFRESVRDEIQFRSVQSTEPERIDIGDAMPTDAVVANKPIDPFLRCR